MKLIDVLKPNYIKIPLEGDSKEAVIKELIQVLHQNQVFEDTEEVFKAVMEREKIMTTGVGKGVAIPHCKHKNCPDFAIGLGIKSSGVEFQSIDNLPAKIIFLLVGPEDNPGMHIRLLSRISRLISKEDLREQLVKCKNSEDAYKLLKNAEDKFFEISG